MGQAVAYLPYIMTAVSTVMSMKGQQQQGAQAQANANYQATQLEQGAGQQVASSQRAMLSDEQQERLAQSRALAVAAASGGGVSDPTVVGILSRLSGEGAYRGMVDLYQGQEKARQMNDQAVATRMMGGDSSSNSKYSSAATLVSGASSLYSKYAADHRPGASGASSGLSYNPGNGYGAGGGRANDFSENMQNYGV